ncbi:hypothetical protein TB2_013206 [Malus domestica]
MSIHLRFEMDMLAFAGCFDIFNPKEQEILKKYRKENFANRYQMTFCILSAMRFNNSTRIYLAAGELFGGHRFMKLFRASRKHPGIVRVCSGLHGLPPL